MLGVQAQLAAWAPKALSLAQPREGASSTQDLEPRTLPPTDLSNAHSPARGAYSPLMTVSMEQCADAATMAENHHAAAGRDIRVLADCEDAEENEKEPLIASAVSSRLGSCQSWG